MVVSGCLVEPGEPRQDLFYACSVASVTVMVQEMFPVDGRVDSKDCTSVSVVELTMTGCRGGGRHASIESGDMGSPEASRTR